MAIIELRGKEVLEVDNPIAKQIKERWLDYVRTRRNSPIEIGTKTILVSEIKSVALDGDMVRDDRASL